MKKILLSVMTLVSLGLASKAMAATLPMGAATLQWAGSIPAETTSGKGYWIVQTGIGFTEGLLTFSNNASGIALNSSSEIGFKVVKDAAELTTPGAIQVYIPGVDIDPMQYAYTITNIKVGIKGFSETQAIDGYFAVHADGSPIPSVIGTEAKKITGLPTVLSIKGRTPAPPADLLSSGDDVVIMAFVSVTPDDTPI